MLSTAAQTPFVAGGEDRLLRRPPTSAGDNQSRNESRNESRNGNRNETNNFVGGKNEAWEEEENPPQHLQFEAKMGEKSEY